MENSLKGILKLKEINLLIENLHDEAKLLEEENESNYNEIGFSLINNELDVCLDLINEKIPFYSIISDIINTYKLILKKNYWPFNKTITFESERLLINNVYIYLYILKLDSSLVYESISEDDKKILKTMKSPRKHNYDSEAKWKEAYDLYEEFYLVSHRDVVVAALNTLKTSNVILTTAEFYIDTLRFFEKTNRLDDVIIDVPLIDNYLNFLKGELLESFKLMISLFEDNKTIFKY